MHIPKAAVAVMGAIAVVIVAAVAVVAWLVLPEDERELRGSCENAAYQLSVEPEDGGLEVNFELISAAPGETWGVVVEQDASILLDGQRVTDEDAELDVDVPTEPIGDNHFVVTATSQSGEACTAELTYD